MPRKRPRPRRVSAEQLASRQRDISVSEFFVKNRHLLGFDSPTRALLTTVKEAVDNAIDACEDAGLLPAVLIEIEPVGDGGTQLRVAVEDKGPGIAERRLPKIFAKLLYGSKFHGLSQSRGQQGLGISAAGMYGQLTTGEPMRIRTRSSPRRPAREFVVSIDTSRNRPRVHHRRTVDWNVKHGTRVELHIEGQYQRGQHSVDRYLRLTALANPHLRLEFEAPDGRRTIHERVVHKRPPTALEIDPHPHGVELGRLQAMLRESGRRTLNSFLTREFSRVGAKAARDILEQAGGLDRGRAPSELDAKEVAALHAALIAAPVSAPDSRCVVPIGEQTLLRGLEREVPAAFYTAHTRRPAVYRGNPFVVEVALAYGRPQGDASELADDEDGVRLGAADSPITLLRFANRVPLLFAAGGCAITRAVSELNWRSYGLNQGGGALPSGPMVLAVHLASVWVPFTSESKEAIAAYPEIAKQLRLALQECGRSLAVHVRSQRKQAREQARRREIERYLPHLGAALQDILGLSDARRDRALVTLERSLDRSRERKP